MCTEEQESSDTPFFSADNKIFEDKSDAGRPCGADFLLAEQESTGHCFALEKVIDGVCSVHKLQGWGPNRANCKRLSTASLAYSRPAIKESPGAEWWQAASVDLKNHAHFDTWSAASGGKGLPAINLKRRHSGLRLGTERERNGKLELQQDQLQPTQCPLAESRDRDEVLRSVRMQYQEALYLSKVQFPVSLR